MKISATLDVGLDVTSCCMCGVQFAMPVQMLQERRDSGKDFWCPNGHTLRFQETTAERLRKQLDTEKERRRSLVGDAYSYANAERARCEAARRSNAALRGANTKLRKRIGGGA